MWLYSSGVDQASILALRLRIPMQQTGSLHFDRDAEIEAVLKSVVSLGA